VCLHDSGNGTVSIESVGAASEGPAVLDLHVGAKMPVGHNGLYRAIQRHVDLRAGLRQGRITLAQRFAGAGLYSMVIAPLSVESNVFGGAGRVRRANGAFSQRDCEFLKQLSEHVALAAHQAQLYGALQRTYEDLRQSQQTVLQTERLRALGEMASGIAHDINNAISRWRCMPSSC
jgi:C4-dicarboxylate-specific signal transduction histidine kinase